MIHNILPKIALNRSNLSHPNDRVQSPFNIFKRRRQFHSIPRKEQLARPEIHPATHHISVTIVCELQVLVRTSLVLICE
jgi:hypothetical protein